MNPQAHILNEPLTKTVRKNCYKCGYIRKTPDKSCPDCGSTLELVSRIKITGAIQIILGSGLLLFIGRIAFWMLNPHSAGRFNGGANDVIFIIFVFGLVISVSLGVLAAGIWQIVFGKRNKLLMFAVIGLAIAFAATGGGVYLSK